MSMSSFSALAQDADAATISGARSGAAHPPHRRGSRTNAWGLFSARIVLAGWALMAATLAGAAPFAYITNQEDATVSVIDTATNIVVATIPVGSSPLSVAVNSAATRAYVANFGANSVSVIDTSTNTVIDTIQLPNNNVQGIAVNAAGTRVYATGSETGHDDGLVSVIDTATDTIVASITVARLPRSVAVNLAGTRVYVGHSEAADHGTVTVIDTSSNTIVTTIQVATDPWGIVTDTSGMRVFVSHRYQDSATHGRLSVIDAQTNTLVSTLTVPGGSYGLAMNHAGTRVYVTNTNFSSSVSVIDAHCAEVIGNIPLPLVQDQARFLYGISVTPDDAHVYVATSQPNFNFNSVAVIDAATNMVVGDVPVGQSPWALGVFISPGALVAPPPGAPIRVTGIELTQGIQDLDNSVTVIYGKRAFARVYVKSDAADIPNVTASLSGLGAYTDGGGGVVEVPLGPLVPSNKGGPRISVKASPKRNIVDDSFVFEIPWEWLGFESLRLGATLSEPAGPPPSGSCRSDLESGPGVNVEQPTHLKVAFVRMAYDFPGSTTERASSSEQLQTESWMRRVYPLSDLNPTPDFELYDAFLGSWVERTAFGCVTGTAEADRNLCAHTYTTARLGSLYASTGLFGFPDGHVIDDIDVVYGLIPQHFVGMTQPYFTRGACCTNSVGAGPANDDDYASHEIGHFLGRQHPVEGSVLCGHTATDANYPYFLSFIAPPLSDPETGFAGFDGGDTNLLKPMNVLPALSSYDIMGYCEPTTWISDYTYHWLYICLLTLNQGGTTAGCPAFGANDAPSAKPLKRAPQTGDWLLAYGTIAADHASATLVDVERIDGIFSEPPRTPGDFSIQLIGDGAVTLADYPFTPDAGDDAVTSDGASGPQLGFGYAVPFVVGTREVRVVNTSTGGAVLASKSVSSNAPVVTDVVAVAGSGSNIALTWSANDVDGDTMHFDVVVARNGGASLQPLMLGLSSTNAQIDTSAIGGGDVTFRVIASDGLLTGHADSNPITLANRPPQPRVLAPANGTHVTLGQVVNLEGVARDLQDGTLADASLAWSSVHGALGTGARLSLANLPLGVNPITLTATNSLGLSATRDVLVVVEADPVVLGPTLTVGPGQIGWHVQQGDLTLQTEELDIGNRGAGTVQFTISSGAPWLSANVTGGTAPATITLTANPAGFADGVSVDTTVTIAAVGLPGQSITVPVRLAVGNTFVAGNAAPPPVDAIYHDGFDGS